MSTDLELTELTEPGEPTGPRSARELEAVYDIPVTVSAVLGKTKQVGEDRLGAAVLVRTVGMQPVAAASRFHVNQGHP